MLIHLCVHTYVWVGMTCTPFHTHVCNLCRNYHIRTNCNISFFNLLHADPSAPSIGFTQTAYGVSEGEGFQSVCVEVSGVVSESFSASVETTDGSATSKKGIELV